MLIVNQVLELNLQFDYQFRIEAGFNETRNKTMRNKSLNYNINFIYILPPTS